MKQLGWSWGLVAFSVAGHLAAHKLGHDAAPGWLTAVQGAAATLALAVPGRDLIVDGMTRLWRRAPNMNSMVSVGCIAAYLSSVAAVAFPHAGWGAPTFEEPVMLLGFILLGRALEARSRLQAAASLVVCAAPPPTHHRTRHNVRSVLLPQELLKLQPVEARVLPRDWDGSARNEDATAVAEVKPVADIGVGSLVLVLPGDKIPCDGVVVSGRSAVDEAALTGESVPVLKERAGADLEGDGRPTTSMVYGGTVCLDGSLVVRATTTGDASALQVRSRTPCWPPPHSVLTGVLCLGYHQHGRRRTIAQGTDSATGRLCCWQVHMGRVGCVCRHGRLLGFGRGLVVATRPRNSWLAGRNATCRCCRSHGGGVSLGSRHATRHGGGMYLVSLRVGVGDSNGDSGGLHCGCQEGLASARW